MNTDYSDCADGVKVLWVLMLKIGEFVFFLILWFALKNMSCHFDPANAGEKSYDSDKTKGFSPLRSSK